MASEWTDTEKAEIIAKYEEANPTAENTMDIVTELAEEYEKSPNGVRMILTKAGVYVKKTPTKSEGKKASGESKGTRVSKEDALNSLTAAIEAAGLEADEDVIKRLTGKAAVYFTEVVKKLNG